MAVFGVCVYWPGAVFLLIVCAPITACLASVFTGGVLFSYAYIYNPYANY
jgi:hypothetical protein